MRSHEWTTCEWQQEQMIRPTFIQNKFFTPLNESTFSSSASTHFIFITLKKNSLKRKLMQLNTTVTQKRSRDSRNINVTTLISIALTHRCTPIASPTPTHTPLISNVVTRLMVMNDNLKVNIGSHPHKDSESVTSWLDLLSLQVDVWRLLSYKLGSHLGEKKLWTFENWLEHTKNAIGHHTSALLYWETRACHPTHLLLLPWCLDHWTNCFTTELESVVTWFILPAIL